MRTVIALACFATFGTAVAAQSGTQNPSSNDRGTKSPSHQVTLTGCVRQTSDQPSTFALQETTKSADTTSGTDEKKSSNSGGASANATGTSGTSSTGASGTTGTSNSASASGSSHGTAWYRLASQGADKLNQYINKPVRIVGSVTPGKDEKGADI